MTALAWNPNRKKRQQKALTHTHMRNGSELRRKTKENKFANWISFSLPLFSLCLTKSLRSSVRISPLLAPLKRRRRRRRLVSSATFGARASPPSSVGRINTDRQTDRQTDGRTDKKE